MMENLRNILELLSEIDHLRALQDDVHNERIKEAIKELRKYRRGLNRDVQRIDYTIKYLETSFNMKR